jgi:5-carboxymethyl-2-hydroxymuconate isomerase
LDALRTRAVERRHYRVADGGADLGFIAITARIGPGRDAADKASFLEHLLDTAQRQVEGEGSEPAIAWSIELQEIDPEFRINRNGVRQRLAERAAPAPPQPTT